MAKPSLPPRYPTHHLDCACGRKYAFDGDYRPITIDTPQGIVLIAEFASQLKAKAPRRGPPRLLSDVQIKAIKETVSAGASILQVAKALNMTYSVIVRYVGPGIAIHGRRGVSDKLSDEDVAEILIENMRDPNGPRPVRERSEPASNDDGMAQAWRDVDGPLNTEHADKAHDHIVESWCSNVDRDANGIRATHQHAYYIIALLSGASKQTTIEVLRREILRRHHDGREPAQIAWHLGLSLGAVLRVIGDPNAPPNDNDDPRNKTTGVPT